MMQTKLKEAFIEKFGSEGDIRTYFAPGRVNLIGEHTDYNGGHVFPCALTIGTYAVARKNNDDVLRFYSLNFEELGVITSSVINLKNIKEDNWTNYPKGVIWALQQEGFKIEQGMDIAICGTIPNGSGLSSSASLEVLTCFVMQDLFGIDIDMIKNALIGQVAENKFIGVNCGIMDQFAIAMGKKNSAIFLDTSDLSYTYAPIELGDAKIVILNTNKKRGLGDSKYNERRAECEKALEELQKVIDIKTLGDLTEEQFEQYKGAIKDDNRVKRAKHAVYENQRTIKAVKALEDNNLDLFGQLMIASHNSLRDDYEVTGIELDTIVAEALKQEGVIGARMTGAGFGGCGVSIVKGDYVDKFIENVGKAYEEKIGYKADFYVVEVGNGPSRLD
ncbi:MAG: galactokinase [Eubacterium sp.]